MISVFIVGDTRIYVEGLDNLLGEESGVEVLGHARRHTTCVASVKSLQPDVLLVDFAMRDSNRTIKEIVAAFPEIRVVVVGVPDTAESAIKCIEAGSSAYVVRKASISDLVESIECATHDELLCSPRIARAFARKISAMAQTQSCSHAEGVLTNREKQVGDLLTRGLSNKGIAKKLNLSESTVKHHVHHLLEKLNVQSRGQAAALLMKSSLP